MKLIYHFGYPRTGTTLLQKTLFPLHSEINYLGPKSYDEKYEVLIDQKTIDDLESFYIQSESKQDIDLNNIEKFVNINLFSTKKVNIFSSEKYLFYQRYQRYGGLLVLMNFLKQHFKDFKLGIFYTVRNQYELIESIYNHSYGFLKKFLNCKNFEDLIAKIDSQKDIEDNNLHNFLKAYDFNYTYEKIKSKFKESEIKIFKFEDLDNNQEKYLLQLSSFLQVNPEEVLSLCGKQKVNPSKIIKKKKILQSEFQRVISNNNLYKKIKFLIPKKLKNKINSFLYIKKETNLEQEKKMRKIVEKFYLKSNENFTKKTGIQIN